mgnify:CR=1 FL=1
MKKSRYKVLLYTGAIIALMAMVLLFFTYKYHIALAICVIVYLYIGVILNSKKAKQLDYNFEISNQGICSFDDDNSYQLQESSRFSFFGFWLILQPIALVGLPLSTNNSKKLLKLFIYRDSLSNNDVSQLSKVISQLSHQH